MMKVTHDEDADVDDGDANDDNNDYNDAVGILGIPGNPNDLLRITDLRTPPRGHPLPMRGQAAMVTQTNQHTSI